MLAHVSLPITLITGSEEVLVRQALDQARAEARAGDLVLTLGAGDVSKLGDRVLDGLRAATGAGGTR